MPIKRYGDTPNFYELLIQYSLVPEYTGNPPSSQVVHQTKEWLYIPNYQRGVTWDPKFINENFLKAESPLLGHVILAQWRLSSGAQDEYPFKNYLLESELPRDEFYHLLDGLQRFSVGTIILNTLNELVFAPTGQFHDWAGHFSVLQSNIANRNTVYQYNHTQFMNHPRRAISLRYTELFNDYKNAFRKIIKESKPSEIEDFLKSINFVLLNKQVAVDPFTGFTKLKDIIKVFLGVNTVRIELNEIDLIRSYLIEKGKAANWSQGDIETLENRFEKIFIARIHPRANLAPFASIVLDAIENDFADRFFPSFYSKLKVKDVQYFLDFVESMESCSGEYIDEIKECGHNPYAVLISWYYMDSLHFSGGTPSFLTGGQHEDKDLHTLLRAMYRSVLDRSMNKVKKYATEICKSSTQMTVQQIADGISQDSVGYSIKRALDPNKTEILLTDIGPDQAPRIFNACLLPTLANAKSFKPLVFGKSTNLFHVDHLIPKKRFDKTLPGGKEADRLFNLAPIPAGDNVAAKATDCSDKLKKTGLYDKPSIKNAHPYNQWLIDVQFPDPSYINKLDFNDQEYLQSHFGPDIGLNRIKKIRELLLAAGL